MLDGTLLKYLLISRLVTLSWVTWVIYNERNLAPIKNHIISALSALMVEVFIAKLIIFDLVAAILSAVSEQFPNYLGKKIPNKNKRTGKEVLEMTYSYSLMGHGIDKIMTYPMETNPRILRRCTQYSKLTPNIPITLRA